jgi:hypothetical protein
VHPNDRLKTTFRTKWGTYAYQKMPFGLINIGATFQREMDVSFRGLINKSVVVYLDDITIYSKKRSDHIHHLKHIFERCRRYGISLNPKKSFFALQEGKLLGFIVSKEGITIEPSRIKAISEIPLPHNKKSMQSFLGQINFVRRFVPDFAQIVLPLQNMIKNNYIFKWNTIEKQAFDSIKQSIIQAPTLLSPDYNKEFILYTFSSDQSYAAMLTQKNDQDAEVPIAFNSSGLQGVELNYSDVEKKAYAVFKSIKHFRPFLIKSHIKVIVPHSAVRNLLVQKDLGEKRSHWVTTLQEYDLEIKPAKIVHGQGLCKLVTQTIDSQSDNSCDDQVSEYLQQVYVTLDLSNSQYSDLIYYLTHGTSPLHLDAKKKCALRLKSNQYQLINGFYLEKL